MDGLLLEVTTILASNRTSVGSEFHGTLTVLEDRRTGVSHGFLRKLRTCSVLREFGSDPCCLFASQVQTE